MSGEIIPSDGYNTVHSINQSARTCNFMYDTYFISFSIFYLSSAILISMITNLHIYHL